ncbi:hypothetical protein chiPu_0019916 [Chiloscyllium punctatum]|uniref:Uncharacterized protein n=1 Tax=Chiloscyllium punctatum TaxID=137246 RepID=A0A401RTI1_CHIPU|nr:hypothetical protein [Chiloscyllium punctatum]
MAGKFSIHFTTILSLYVFGACSWSTEFEDPSSGLSFPGLKTDDADSELSADFSELGSGFDDENIGDNPSPSQWSPNKMPAFIVYSAVSLICGKLLAFLGIMMAYRRACLIDRGLSHSLNFLSLGQKSWSVGTIPQRL